MQSLYKILYYIKGEKNLGRKKKFKHYSPYAIIHMKKNILEYVNEKKR